MVREGSGQPASPITLAGTPVREVKALVDDRPADDRRGRRGGGRRRDRDREGGGRPPRGDRDRDRDRDRGGRDRDDRQGGERASRDDVAAHGRDEAFKPTIRIVTAEDAKERRERERAEKAEKEAKRQAERDRLSKFGY